MPDLDATFAALSAVLRKHASAFSIRTDEPGHLYVELPAATPKGKPGFFGAVQARKSFVSYHLMPVYEDPGLLDGISAALRGRMQARPASTCGTAIPRSSRSDFLTQVCGGR